MNREAHPSQRKADGADTAIGIHDTFSLTTLKQPVAQNLHDSFGLRRVDLKERGAAQSQRHPAELFVNALHSSNTSGLGTEHKIVGLRLKVETHALDGGPTFEPARGKLLSTR